MQRLVYNLTGQTLTHVPDVRRATATWVLEDLLRSTTDAARTLDSDSASVDAATEVLTADAGPTEEDPRSLLMASTSGFVVGHTYELAGVDGEREAVQVVGVEATELHLAHPLLGTYPAGSTIRGLELVTSAIADAVVQNEQRVQGDWPMRIVWTYPDGSRFHEAVRLVREDRHDLLVTAIAADISDQFPDVRTRLVHHGRQTLEPHIRVMLRQIRADLLSRGIRAEELLTGDKGHWVAVWRVLWHLARMGDAPGSGPTTAAEWATYCKGEYERCWHALTVGEGGHEVVHVETVSSTAPASTDLTYRRVIQDL